MPWIKCCLGQQHFQLFVEILKTYLNNNAIPAWFTGGDYFTLTSK
jgi:hypothetical protein